MVAYILASDGTHLVAKMSKPITEERLFDLLEPVIGRSSERYTHRDLGDRVNAAIDDLPERGGRVLPPHGSCKYEAPIKITRGGIQLVGLGGGGKSRWAATELQYMGTETGISVGNGETGCLGVRLADFALTARHGARRAIRFEDRVGRTNGHASLERLSLLGNRKEAEITGIDLGQRNVFFEVTACNFVGCTVGLELPKSNHHTVVTRCQAHYSDVGYRIAEPGCSTSVRFLGCDAETCDVAGFDIRNGRSVSLEHFYSEGSLRTKAPIVRIGTPGGPTPRSVVIRAGYMNPQERCNYPIELWRVNGLTVKEIVSYGSGLVENHAEDVSGIVLRNNWHRGPAISDGTGVIELLDPKGCEGVDG